ncbi:hypothetical protein D3C86_2040700 [compost metagenome]
MQPGNTKLTGQFMVLVQCNTPEEPRLDLYQQCAQLSLGRAGLAHVQARKPVCEELVNNSSFSGQHFRVRYDDQLHYR